MTNDTQASAPAGLHVDCPGCGRRIAYRTDNPHRPFCSQRCKTNDLGAWASEEYRIAGDNLDASSDDDDPR